MLRYEINGKQLEIAYNIIKTQLNDLNIFQFDVKCLKPIELRMILVAIAKDNPQQWWKQDTLKFVQLSYKIQVYIEPYQQQLNNIIFNLCQGQKSCIRQYYDILRTILECSRFNSLEQQTENQENIIGCLVEHKTNCSGFAKSFQYLSQKLDLQASIIEGCVPVYTVEMEQDNQTHVWCVIYLFNEYYMIDPTHYAENMSKLEQTYHCDDEYLIHELQQHQQIFMEYQTFCTCYDRHLKLIHPFKVDIQFCVDRISILNNVLTAESQIVEIISLSFKEMLLKQQTLHFICDLFEINNQLIQQYFDTANQSSSLQFTLDNVIIQYTQRELKNTLSNRFVYLTISRKGINQVTQFQKELLRMMKKGKRYLHVYDAMIKNKFTLKYYIENDLNFTDVFTVAAAVKLDNPQLWWLALDVECIENDTIQVTNLWADVFDNQKVINLIAYTNTVLSRSYDSDVQQCFQCLRTVMTGLIIKADAGDSIIDALIHRVCTVFAAQKAFQFLCDQLGISCTLLRGVVQNTMDVYLRPSICTLCYIKLKNTYYYFDIFLQSDNFTPPQQLHIILKQIQRPNIRFHVFLTSLYWNLQVTHFERAFEFNPRFCQNLSQQVSSSVFNYLQQNVQKSPMFLFCEKCDELKCIVFTFTRGVNQIRSGNEIKTFFVEGVQEFEDQKGLFALHFRTNELK
ncbi:Transglutaminase-like_superfamily protein [Hexamita inflata]|uniref:Transglutaminase-like superfamily protein n=1 Tax=Hexamita inflata TaxID=28002 RepID=A0AA86R0H3_9EUKA|nr:Transglutaminase-like superfamily protein [Hexamita inflata]